MWDVRACRGCLAVKGKLEKIGDTFNRLYAALTGLEITECDGYPNYFCVECRAQIKKCLAFRRKSRRAHFVMKEIMSVRKQVTYSDIVTVNRKKTNLESSLNFWEPLKTNYLVINENDPEQKILVPAERTYSAYNTCLVDIKPVIETIKAEETAVEEVTAKETITALEENIEAPDTGSVEAFDNDADAEQDQLDVDLSDVFKDLNDEVAESDVEIEADKSKRKNQTNKELNKPHPEDVFAKQSKKLKLPATMKALEMCEIKVLSLEEQQQVMDVRRMIDPFYHAQYKCSMCLTVHVNMEELISHVEFHNSRRTGHECEVCRNKFPTVEELTVHSARYHMYEYKCKCNATYYTLYDIVEHCRSCAFNKKEEMLKKKRTVHDKLQLFTVNALSPKMMREIQALRADTADLQAKRQEPATKSASDMKCDICGIWRPSFRAMEKHMLLSHEYLYTCKECKEVFTKRKHAMQHVPTHKSGKRFCPDCGMGFDKKVSLSLHRVKAHGSQIPCNLCGKCCKSRTAHFNHQLVHHKYISVNDPLVGDPQCKCVDCGVQFIDKRALDIHLVSVNHTGASDIAFACVPCRKIFESEDQMETHYITCVNPKKYPRKCCYCEEILLDSMHYKTHYIRQHPTLQYRYIRYNAICELCGKSIFRPQLEAHLKTHAGFAHECRHCGVASGAASAHVAHVLSAHAARPYCCALCARRFQHRSDCKDHILKVHAPAKLYKCEFCGFEFSYFPHLKEHSEKKHNLVIPPMRSKPLRSKEKIFVYAHMIIEISLLEKEIVEKADIQMLDYLDQKSIPADYRDFFRFNSEADEYIVRIDKRTRKKKPKKPKIKIESDVVVAPGVADESAVMNDFEFEYKIEGPKVKIEMLGSEVENAVRGLKTEGLSPRHEPNILEQEDVPERDVMEHDALEQDVLEHDVLEQDVLEQEDVLERDVLEHDVLEQYVTEQEVEQEEQDILEQQVNATIGNDEVVDGSQIDDGKPLEVLEHDGNQYVMIAGQMYRIACDDED